MIPVAHRELLVASRRRSTVLVRAVCGSVCLIVWLLLYLALASVMPQPGLNGFYAMSGMAFIYCIMAGFFFTADTITSERREGTLPLLFHSHTTVLDVTLGKFLGESLAPIYGFLAVLPFFALPILDGGVTLSWVAKTAAALTLTIVFSLSAGMLGSILTNEDDAAYLQTGLLLAAPAVPFGAGVVLILLWGFFKKQLSLGTRIFALLAGLLFIGVCAWAVAATGDFFTGAPTALWQLSFAPGSTGFAVTATVLALNTLLYLAAGVLLVDPHIANGKTKELRRSKAARRNDTPLSAFVAQVTRPAILLARLAVALLLITALFSFWSKVNGTPAAAGSFRATDLLAGVFVSVVFARLAVATPGVLRQTRFFETLLSTPLQLNELIEAARKMFWRTAVWGVIAMEIHQVLSIVAIVMTVPQWNASASFYIQNVGHFALSILSYATVFWLGTWFALRYRKTGLTVLLTLAVGWVVPGFASVLCTLAAVKFLPLLDSILGGSTQIGQLIQFAPMAGQAGILWFLIHRAKERINLLTQDPEWRAAL